MTVLRLRENDVVRLKNEPEVLGVLYCPPPGIDAMKMLTNDGRDLWITDESLVEKLS